MENKGLAVLICIFGIIGLVVGITGIVTNLSRGPVYDKDTGDFMIDVFNRHGYQQEDLIAELENENGVRLYSDAEGSLYLVYGSTSVPDASYRIVKKSWDK